MTGSKTPCTAPLTLTCTKLSPNPTPTLRNKLTPKRALQILALINSATPNTKPVVSSKDSFKVLISTVLSQRTRDANTAIATEQLFKEYKIPEQIASAPLKKIESLIKPAGFYKTKAKKIKSISKKLIQKYNSKTPSDLETLTTLPGVGRKTANCVLCFAFHKAAIPVDVHVHRISNRIGLVKTNSPDETEIALAELFPKKHWKSLNHSFVKFGQTICKPISPKCLNCPVNLFCSYFANTCPKQNTH